MRNDIIKPTLYGCMETGVITERDNTVPAQFSAVKKYDILYAEELPRFRNHPLHIYGVPFFNTPERKYLGLGRNGLYRTSKKRRFPSRAQKELIRRVEAYWEEEDFFAEMMRREESAKAFLALFRHAPKHELIWTRISGSEEAVPEKWRFLGYDIAYAPDCDGAFSMICDCMFICRWHGCDPDGVLFREDFDRLNENGLFSSHADAYKYMVKYLSEAWSERGEFGIYEVYCE